MFTEKNLKNLGIEAIEEIEDNNVIEVISQVSTKLVATFPDNNLKYLDIYRTLLSTPMYYAKIAKGMSKVNYYYKNSTIYFSEDTNFNEVDEYIFHECIHKLQEHKDKKGKLTRMGLCEINELSVKATALNEAAIQYITSKSLNIPQKLITVYDITLPCKTEYYPILTNLISQLAFLLGEETLVDSTINSNEDFKIEIIDNLGEAEYNYIEKNFDEILQTKNNILELQQNFDMNQQIGSQILKNIQNIRTLYLETQNKIFTSYFENLLKRVESLEEISILRKKLYSYRSLIGTTTGYDFFNSYCTDLDKRARDKIEEIKTKTSLVVIRENKFLNMLKKIKRLFINSQNEYYK